MGIGSLLRGDDAAGHAVAEALAALEYDDVEVVRVHQLTPELATELEGRSLVVFVDAAVDTDRVRLTPLATDTSGRLLTHHLGPAGLLGLAAGLGTAPRAATLVSVPVHDLRLGTELSAQTRAHLEEAVEAVVALLDH